MGGNGLAVLYHSNLVNITRLGDHEAADGFDLDIHLVTFEDGFESTEVTLSNDQVQDLTDDIHALPEHDNDRVFLTIAEGTDCEAIRQSVRQSVGALVTDSDLDAFTQRLPLDGNCQMRTGAVVDLTPLNNEMLVRFQVRLQSDQRVLDAEAAYNAAERALNDYPDQYGSVTCSDSAEICAEQSRLNRELRQARDAYYQTLASVYEELVAQGLLPPMAASIAESDRQAEILLAVASVFVPLSAADVAIDMSTAGVGRIGRIGKSIERVIDALNGGKRVPLNDRLATDASERVAEARRGDGVDVSNSAFKEALSGGRHSGFLKNYANKSASELRSGIKSIEKQIAEHRDKIANPDKYIPNFRDLDPRQQEALTTRKWPGDIQRQQEQRDILRGLLERAGGD